MADPRVLCWFSRGAASAVMTQLVLRSGRNEPVVPVTCVTGSEHPDNDRFERDCEEWFGQKVTSLRNAKYKDTWEVWEKRRFIAGIKGAPCTAALKIEPRLDFQRIDDIHVFGYTADKEDVKRAERLRETFFELTIETPLIDRGITKAECLALLKEAGIAPPLTYALGLPNGNCIPCGKATSPNYYALIRKYFPPEFWRFNALCRELGVRPTRINNIRIYPDEIPEDWPTTEPIVPACDMLCQAAAMDLSPTTEQGDEKP